MHGYYLLEILLHVDSLFCSLPAYERFPYRLLASVLTSYRNEWQSGENVRRTGQVGWGLKDFTPQRYRN